MPVDGPFDVLGAAVVALDLAAEVPEFQQLRVAEAGLAPAVFRGLDVFDAAAGGGVEDVETPEDRRREPCLSDPELLELRDLGRKVERHYGRPQDIEWAIDRHGAGILLLQSRPETVWSQKDAAPVAAASDNPLSHVMGIFGGRK